MRWVGNRGNCRLVDAKARPAGPSPAAVLPGELLRPLPPVRQGALGVAVGLGAARRRPAPARPGTTGCARGPCSSAGSRARWRSARRPAPPCARTSRAPSPRRRAPWCSQFAICWLEIRSVARSSISPTPSRSGHRGAADAQPDPAHDVAEDRLGVGLQLVALAARRSAAPRPAAPGATSSLRRSVSGRVASSRCTACTSVPGSAARAGSPRSARAPRRLFAPAFGCAPLVSSIVGHPGGLGPHALADLGLPGEARRAARRRRCGSRRPAARRWTSSSSLRITGPASNTVWISSPVRSRKPVFTKITRSSAARDARLEVQRRPPLLVHDPDLDRARRQPQRLLDGGEQVDDSATSSGPCMLGLDDVQAAGAGVGVPAQPAQVVQRGDRR